MDPEQEAPAHPFYDDQDKTVPPEESAAAPKEGWWFVEAWTKLRPFAIEMVVEAVVFGLFLLSLEGFHQLVDRTSLDQDDIILLHKFHFYSHFVVLGIFALSFIIQVLFRKYEELFEEGK